MTTTPQLVDADTADAADTATTAARSGPRRVAWVIVLLFLGMGALLVADQLFNPAKYRIEHVEVYGQLENVDGEEVKNVVEAALDGNYFSVNLESIEAEILRLPWAHAASVRRKWPATLVVDVEEVQPVARWGDDGWLNVTGEVVIIDPSLAPPVYHALPVISGAERNAQVIWRTFQKWSRQFLGSGLVLDGLVLDDSGVWKLSVDPGAAGGAAGRRIQVTVERAGADEKIDRLLSSLSSEPPAWQLAQVEKIDLRYANGIAVAWREGGQTQPAAGAPESASAAVSSLE